MGDVIVAPIFFWRFCNGVHRVSPYRRRMGAVVIPSIHACVNITFMILLTNFYIFSMCFVRITLHVHYVFPERCTRMHGNVDKHHIPQASNIDILVEKGALS